jgi:DNA-damage-inducible protein J
MAQAMINFRMDENLKKGMEQACKDMGMSMTTAFTIFATKVSRERRIPFEVAADPDPFYSEKNMAQLRTAVADAKAGRNMTEHELVEVEDD